MLRRQGLTSPRSCKTASEYLWQFVLNEDLERRYIDHSAVNAARMIKIVPRTNPVFLYI